MTHTPNPTQCLIRMDKVVVVVFDSLPKPEVLGEAFIKMLRTGELGEQSRKHFQDVVRADWEWKKVHDTHYRTTLHEVPLYALLVPFFQSGNKKYRSRSTDER